MAMTHEELKALVSARVDEVTLIDILGLTSEDIVEAFADLLEDNRYKFLDLVGDDEEEQQDEY